MNKYMIIVFILLLQGIASAQYSGLYGENLNQNSNRLQGKLTGEVFYLSLTGNANHFLQSDWVEGTITLKDGDVFEGVRMRYMAFGDELVAYNSNIHTLFIVDKNTVKQFTIKTPLSSGSFAERKFINLDSLNVFLDRTYFEELFAGTVKLLVFYQIEERKISPFIDSSGKLSDTEFQLKTIYYIMSQSKELIKMQLKNRNLFKLYPESKKEIRKLLRKNKINIVDKSSAIQAFELIDANGFLK
jgi:hypothetical protein